MAQRNRRKYCFVQECQNSTALTPNKVFVTVPKNLARRKLWFEAVGLDLECYSSTVYCCEDHFDLPNDMDNWMEYSLMKCKIRLKQSVVPYIFNRKPDWNKTANATDLSADIFKRRRRRVITAHECSDRKRTGLVSILRKDALKREEKEITNEIVPSSSSIISCDVKNDVLPHTSECQSDRKRTGLVSIIKKDAVKRQQKGITNKILPSSSSVVSLEDSNLFLVVFTPSQSIYNQECKKIKIEEISASNCGIEFVDVNSVDNTSELLDNSAPIDDKSNVLIESVNIKTEYDPDNIQDYTYVTDDCGQEFIIKTEIDIKEEMLDD